MASQPEVSNFDAGVYQFETTDVVEGGVGGVDNKPLLNLANRTLWLKNQITSISASITGILSSITSLTNRVIVLEVNQPKTVFFLKKGTATVGDIPASSYKIVTVSFPTLGTNNYMVAGTLVSKSADDFVDTSCTWGVREKTATYFKIWIRELSGEVQNLEVDYCIIPF